MIDGNVCNAAVPTQKVSTLSMDVHDREYLVILKRVETPPFFGDTSFWGLTVLNDYTSKGVSVLKKCPREFKAWFFFNRHLSVFVVASRPRHQLLSTTAVSAAFALLAVLPAPGIVKLTLFFLRLQALAISLPSLRWPAPRPLTRASPLAGMTPVSVSVTVPSPPVFLTGWFTVLPILPPSPGVILVFLKSKQTQLCGAGHHLEGAALQSLGISILAFRTESSTDVK